MATNWNYPKQQDMLLVVAAIFLEKKKNQFSRCVYSSYKIFVWRSRGALCRWSFCLTQWTQLTFSAMVTQCLESWFSWQKKLMDLRDFLPGRSSLSKILAIILGKICQILQNFLGSCKEIPEKSWTSWPEELPKSWQKVYPRNPRSWQKTPDTSTKCKIFAKKTKIPSTG